MSLENEIESFPNEAAESFRESKKHSKLSYTREFLLSLSELDVCKTLPSGLDPSVLSEFEDASHGIQDRQRIPSSLPFQSCRRTEYGSSPPTKGDSSNYSRGIYGKWDSRSSGRNERDSDSQSDWDSDTGWRHCNQTRRSWQSPEHAGLLGSGSFPRPSGYVAELSAPKVRSNDHYQLNRTNEPYHPPRPYKAIPHLRRGTNDSYNDETFGATECASQDKAEEEKRRRESFELMRKEQQKSLQEKNKLNPDKHKNGHVADIVELLGDTKDGKRVFNRSNELDESMTHPVSNNDSSKSSVQIPGSRPLVPPGFKSTILEKSSTTRPATHSNSAEVEGTEIEESLFHSKAVVQNGTIDIPEERQSAQKMGFREQQLEIMNISISLKRGEQIVDSSADLEVSYKNLCVDNQLDRLSSLSEASETQDVSESVEFDTKNATGHKIIGNSKQDHSKTILEQLLGSPSTVNLGGSSAIVEPHDAERDGSWSPNAVPSSKFAHWFLEDEKKASEDPMKARPSDLLSLIVGGERLGIQVSDAKATKHIPPDFPIQSAGFTNRHLTSNMASSTIGISEQFYNCNEQEAVLPILTCKDLEQTILSEYSESSVTLKGLSFSGAKAEESKADIDDRASRHLLSLLKKGSGLIDNADSPNIEGGSLDKLHASEGAIVGSALDNSRQEKAENIHQSGRTLTLETLFGSAFMKELQSVEAPVSVQRGSGGSTRTDISEPHRLSFGVMGDALFPTSTVGIGSERSSHESNILQSKTKPDKIENWLGIKDTRVEVDPSNHQSAILSKLSGFDVAVDVQLPEEESLITVSDHVNPPNSMFISAVNSTKRELLLSEKPLDISEKLAALSTVFKDERRMIGQEGPPFVHGPYDPMEAEIPFRNFHAQPSSPQFQPPQMNCGRPFFHPLDSYPTHISSQLNFMAPEGIPGHDAPVNQQFPTNMSRPPFHHSGPAGYDLPHHSMLQQMQMPGNFPPPHIRQEFPRGALLPPHPSNHATGFPQAQNTIQGLPFVHQQPNFGGIGMQFQGPDVSGGSNHPEAFQRLLEMELRANSMKIHPFGAASRGQGMRGHELDNRGFRYR